MQVTAAYTPLQTITAATCEFSVQGCILQILGITGNTSETGHLTCVGTAKTKSFSLQTVIFHDYWKDCCQYRVTESDPAERKMFSLVEMISFSPGLTTVMRWEKKQNTKYHHLQTRNWKVFSVMTSSWKVFLENIVCTLGDGIKSNSTPLVKRNAMRYHTQAHESMEDSAS